MAEQNEGTQPETPAEAPLFEVEMPEGTEIPGETPDETPETRETDESEGKYKIGEKSFNTLEEANAYAVSQLSTLELEKQISDAYRQGIRDTVGNPHVNSNVTQSETAAPEDDFNEEEYYSNPKDFLKKFESKITERALNTVQKTQTLKEQSEQIWREFAERHPQFADFRDEVEDFAAKNTPEVQGVIATKGRPAGYDFIALKLKQRFDRYAAAAKPSRALPNSTPQSPPRTNSAGVTQKPDAKKPSTMAEQMRSLRKNR